MHEITKAVLDREPKVAEAYEVYRETARLLRGIEEALGRHVEFQETTSDTRAVVIRNERGGATTIP